MPGTLYVVATPIGNLEDVTARALRVLREVAVIAAEDTRRTAHLLARYAITTPTTSLHEHNEALKAAALIARLGAGDDVALVSDAGTPTISDPGRVLIQRAAEAGVRIEAIPGPSAAITALAMSGFASDSFTFMGFPPTRSSDRKAWFERARLVGGTVVFYEAPHRIVQTLEQFRTAVSDCEVVVCRELTKSHETVMRGRISAIVGSLLPKGEFTVVAEIGETTENMPGVKVSDGDMFHEFCRMTDEMGVTRRIAVGRLAKQYGISANEVYASIERAKKLVV